MDALSIELKTYYANLSRLLSHEGKFVLIHSRTIDGVFETYADAMTAGCVKLGVEKTFLVKKIARH